MIYEGAAVPKKKTGFQLSKIFDYWTTGAKELEKSAPGQLVTAPIRVPAAVVTTARKALEATGKTVETVPGAAKTLPVVFIILAGGVAAYLVFAGKKGTKLTPF
jgi:hypothetical protein